MSSAARSVASSRGIPRSRPAYVMSWRPVSRSKSLSPSGSTPSSRLAADRVGPDVVPEHEGLARVGSQQARHHGERRRLAGAVGADETEERPPRHVEVDAP